MWQVSISTTAEAEEAVASLLERFFDAGVSVYRDEATGATKAAAYPRRLPCPAASVRAQLRGELRRLKGFGLEIGRGQITVKQLPRENWAESWKRHFKPIEIGPALLVKPGWSRRRPRKGQAVVILDPGLSFGTGQHPTTLFCLQQLAQGRRAGARQSFLDIGTGSGILAIAAAKLGYSPIEAFDYDPAAVRVSRQNAIKNRVRKSVWPKRADLTKLKNDNGKKYDVICANLTWDLLVSEAAKIRARLKPRGKLIVAGILLAQFNDVAKILQSCGLTLEASKINSTWQSGRFVL